MNNASTQSRPSQIKAELKFNAEKNTLVIYPPVGAPVYLNANLVKHVLGVPYTKKDGTYVSAEAIAQGQAQRASKRHENA